MADFVTPITFSVNTTLADGDRFIDGGGAVTIDGATLTIPAGATIDWVVNAGTKSLQTINFLNGGILDADGTPGSPIEIRADPGASTDRSYWSRIDFTNAGPCILRNVTLRNAGFGLFQIGEDHVFDDVTIRVGGGGFGTPSGTVELQAGGGSFRAAPGSENLIIDCDSGIRLFGSGVMERLRIEPDVVGTALTTGAPLGGKTITVRRVFLKRGTIEITGLLGSVIFEDLELQAGATIGGAADIIGKPWIDIDASGGTFTIDGFAFDNPGASGAVGYQYIVFGSSLASTFNFFGFDVRFSSTVFISFFLECTTISSDSIVRIGDGQFLSATAAILAVAIAGGPGSFEVATVTFGDPDDSTSTGHQAFRSTVPGAGGAVTFTDCFFPQMGRASGGSLDNIIETVRSHAQVYLRCGFVDNVTSLAPTSMVSFQTGGSVIIDACEFTTSRTSGAIWRAITVVTGTTLTLRNSSIQGYNDTSCFGVLLSNTTANIRNTTITATAGAFNPGASASAGIEIAGGNSTTNVLACVIEGWTIGLNLDNVLNATGVSDCTTYKLNRVGIERTYALNPFGTPFFCQFSNFEGNTVEGINNVPRGSGSPLFLQFDARFCFWDSTDGPSGFGPGTGDSVSDFVTFDPFNQLRCDNFGIFLGDQDLQDKVKGMEVAFALNSAAKMTFTIEDFSSEFTREDLGAKPVDLITGVDRVMRAWVQIATPIYTGPSTRDFRVVAYDALGWARLRKVPNDAPFNYTDTDPAEIFRDLVDVLNILIPGTTITHDLTSIPDSTEKVTIDLRDVMIFDAMDTLRKLLPEFRAFWIDRDLVVHFAGQTSTAKTLEATELDAMTNPLDLAEVFNRITYIYDSGSKTVVPKPRNFDTILKFGVRDFVRRESVVTDDIIADGNAAVILNDKGAVLEDIEATLDLDFFRFDLRDLITVNVPIMELDGVEREVTEIRHRIDLLINRDDQDLPPHQDGKTVLTLGAIPLRVADYWLALQE